jgi:hypothetical protein
MTARRPGYPGLVISAHLPSLVRGIASLWRVTTLRMQSERGSDRMSSTQHQRSEGLMGDAEDAPENDELTRNVLGLIGAYGMGTALDAQDLFPKRTTRAPAPESEQATGVAA